MSEQNIVTLETDHFAADTPIREVRFAATMVGGTSLAIYECGAAIELFRMVHGQGVYGLLKRLTRSHAFVDILSGTSAGGINAITLSAAIANGSDIGPARDIWVRGAGFDDLLNRPEEGAPPTLFRGDSYYMDQQRKLFNDIVNRTTRPDSPLPSGFPGKVSDPRTGKEQGYDLDLFVTGTYFEGQGRAFFDISDQPIFTADFNGVFHLKHRPRRSVSHFRPDLPDPGDATFKTQQDSKNREKTANRLARIGRTTSSLPALFEPSKVTREIVGNTITLQRDGDKTNWFFDGGFLNNRPINLALNEVFNRSATTEVSRKFVLVEPVAIAPPQHTADAPAAPSAVKALLFYLTVPGNQSISASLQDLADFNHKVVRTAQTLRYIRQQRVIDRKIAVSSGEWNVWRKMREEDLIFDALWAVSQGMSFSNLGGVLDEAAIFLPEVDRERRLTLFNAVKSRLSDTDIKTIIRRLLEKPDLKTLFRWVNLVRAEVRDLRFPRNPDNLKPDPYKSQLSYEAETHWSETRGDASGNVKDLLEALTTLRSEITADMYTLQNAIQTMVKSDLDNAAGAATAVAPEQVVNSILTQWTTAFDKSPAYQEQLLKLTQELAEALRPLILQNQTTRIHDGDDPFGWALDKSSPLLLMQSIHDLDAILYPYQRLAESRGESPVDVIYVSARSRQGGLSGVPAEDKLAGDALFNAGGFLKRAWRVNDIMWGQLDTADALVAELLEPARLERLKGKDGTFSEARRAEIVALVAEYMQGGSNRSEPDAIGALLLETLNSPRWPDAARWKERALAATTGAELAEALREAILIRHQLEIANGAIPDAIASEIAEYAEQSAQNLTPDAPPRINGEFGDLYKETRAMFPLPLPGTGVVTEQLFAFARNGVTAKLPGADAARLMIEGKYHIGGENQNEDIPKLVTLQRGAQSALVALQIIGKLVPKAIDRTALVLPRGLLWILHGLFLAMRQGKTGRTAVISASLLLLIGIPVLAALGLTVAKAQIPLAGLWVLALCLGAAVAHLRRGPAASVGWTIIGLSVLLLSVAYNLIANFSASKQLHFLAILLAFIAAVLVVGGAFVYTFRHEKVSGGAILRILAALALAGGSGYALWFYGPEGELFSLDSPLYWRGNLFGMLGLAGAAAALILGGMQGKYNKETPPGIVAFELAGTQERAAALLESWPAGGGQAATEALRLDQWFVFAYTVTFALFSAQAGYWLRGLLTLSPYDFLSIHATTLAFAATLGGIALSLLAGLLDFSENLALFGEIEACRAASPDTAGQTIAATGLDSADNRPLLYRLAVRPGDLGYLPLFAARCAGWKFAFSLLALAFFGGVGLLRGLGPIGEMRWVSLIVGGLSVVLLLLFVVTLLKPRPYPKPRP